MRKWAAGGLVVLLLAGAQLFQPPPPRASLPGEYPISHHIDVPPDVDRLLRVACYDCHSADTHFPWYTRISPVSWWIAEDVQGGRNDLDFSRWSDHPVVEPTQQQRLAWICRDLRQEIMPPEAYELLHPSARLSLEEKERICEWTEAALSGLEER